MFFACHEEPYKAVLDERLPLSAAHSIVDSLAALTVQKSVSGEQDNGAASVVPKEAKAAAPLPKNNRSGSASPTNIVAPTSAKVPALSKDAKQHSASVLEVKKNKAAAPLPKNNRSGSASPTNIVAPKSAKVPALTQADSKTPSSATASVAPKTEAGVASLPKIESKRSTADIFDKAEQQRLPSSSDPKVALAASASSSVDRQEDRKGAVSDTLLQHFKRVEVEFEGDLDLVELASEVFIGKDVDCSDLPTTLRCFHNDVFFHELVKIAFNSSSEELAVKRMADFQSRVAKLATLRSADE
jgi:hypothetical protein